MCIGVARTVAVLSRCVSMCYRDQFELSFRSATVLTMSKLRLSWYVLMYLRARWLWSRPVIDFDRRVATIVVARMRRTTFRPPLWVSFILKHV
jgi:hypothetical protein